MNGEYMSLETAKKTRRYNILLKRIRLLKKENERLYSIINEVREYIEDNFYQSGGCVGGTDLPYSYIEELLEILDKENNNE